MRTNNQREETNCPVCLGTGKIYKSNLMKKKTRFF